MSGNFKGHKYRGWLWQQILEANIETTKPFNQHSVDDMVRLIAEAGIELGPEPDFTEELPAKKPAAEYPRSNEPAPDEMPGQRLNTQSADDVIRVDDLGRMWHQEEVLKPSYPKPRGRRVLTYMESGVTTKTVQEGKYRETFEVAGNEALRPAEVKITLPSYQVGIYTDPRFPFKVYCYDGREGFDLTEVEAYYGGAALVPPTCKRTYVENVLCYDIRSVIQTIQAEYRHLQLTGKLT